MFSRQQAGSDGRDHVRARWVVAIACVLVIVLVAGIIVVQLNRDSPRGHSAPAPSVAQRQTSETGAAKPSAPVGNREVSVPVTVTAGGTATLTDGTRVVIPAGAISHDGTLRLSRTDKGAPTAPSGLSALGTPLHITLTGAALTGRATLTVPATTPQAWPQALPFAPWVSSYDEASAQWSPTAAVFDPVRQVVTVQVSHFSWWNPFTWDYHAIALGIRQTVSDMSETPSGIPITCDHPPATVTTSSGGSQVTDSCLDDVDGKHVLKMRGTKNFPLLVTWSGNATKAGGGYFGFDVTGVTQWLVNKLQKSATNSVAIRPGGDLTLAVSPDANGPVLVTATYDPQLQLIGILDALTRVVTAIRSALGLDKVADNVFAAMSTSGCLADNAKDLQKSPAEATFKVVTDCLGSIIKDAAKSAPNLLLRLLGTVPAVLGSLLAVVAYAGATIMRPLLIGQDVFTGKTAQSWTIRTPDSPTSAPTASDGTSLWPTGDNEGPPTLFAWLGANMMGFPSFSSCDAAGTYCIVGLNDTVDIISLKDLKEVGSVPLAVADPTKALEQQGLSPTKATQLLQPGPVR